MARRHPLSAIIVPADPATLAPDSMRELARKIARACGKKPLENDEEAEVTSDTGGVAHSRASFLTYVDRNPGHGTYKELERMLGRFMVKPNPTAAGPVVAAFLSSAWLPRYSIKTTAY